MTRKYAYHLRNAGELILKPEWTTFCGLIPENAAHSVRVPSAVTCKKCLKLLKRTQAEKVVEPK